MSNVKKRGHNIPQFHNAVAYLSLFSSGESFRTGNDHGDMAAALVRTGLAEKMMVTQFFPMVGSEQNDCVVHQAVFYESLNQSSNLVIHVSDAGVVANLSLSCQFRIDRAGGGVINSSQPLVVLGMFPVTDGRRGQIFTLIKIKIILRRVKGRMGAQIGGHQEKWLGSISAAQKIDGAGSYPVGRMQGFVINPRACHPGIAFHAGIGNIRFDALFIFQPVKIIVGDFLRLVVRGFRITIRMKIAVMQFNIVKAHKIAQRMHMHFSHTLGVIAGLCQFTGHGMGIIEIYQILIAYTAVFFLGKTGVKGRSCRNTAGAGRVGVVKKRAFGCQRIQKRGLHVGMAGDSHTISAHLVRHD